MNIGRDSASPFTIVLWWNLEPNSTVMRAIILIGVALETARRLDGHPLSRITFGEYTSNVL